MAHSFVNEDAAQKMFPKSKLAPLPQATPPNVSSQKANKLPANTASVQSWPMVSHHPETLLKPKPTAGQLQPTIRPAAHLADIQSVHAKMAARLQQQGSADEAVQLRSQPPDDHSKAAFALVNLIDNTTAAVTPHCGLAMDNRMESDAVPSAGIAAFTDALQAKLQDGGLDLQNVTAQLAGNMNSNVLPEDSSRECNPPSVTTEAVKAELAVGQRASASECTHVVADQAAHIEPPVHQAKEAAGQHVGKGSSIEAAQHHTSEDLVAHVADFDRDTAAAAINMSALHHVEMSSARPVSPNNLVMQNPADASTAQEAHPFFILIQSGQAQLQAGSKRRMPFSWYKYGRTWRRLYTV